jgi:hypothetical protein
MIPTAIKISPIVHKRPLPNTRPRINRITPSTIMLKPFSHVTGIKRAAQTQAAKEQLRVGASEAIRGGR